MLRHLEDLALPYSMLIFLNILYDGTAVDSTCVVPPVRGQQPMHAGHDASTHAEHLHKF